MTPAQITFDMNKVSYMEYRYRNQHGQITAYEPKGPTVNGSQFCPDDPALVHADWPVETLLDRAKRRDLLDVWEPECVVHMMAKNSIRFTGEKAKNVWKAWNAKVYAN